MEAPTNLDRVAFQTLKVRRRNGVSAKVLNAPCAGNAFGLGLDERPPTRSPSCPAPLDSCDHRCGLLSGLGLATNVPHHLREAIHRVQAVEMPLVEGLQAKPLGMEGGRAHWWFRVRPNVRAEPTPEAQRVSPTCEAVGTTTRRAYVLCRRRSARARG
jgi:hypothetical protein